MTTTQTTPNGDTIPSGFPVIESGAEGGISWFIAEAPLWGAVNGYARLPEGHPWRELDLQCADYERGPEVHGGVTYGPTEDGWIGFDTLHGGDNWPGSPRYGGRTEWDIDWTAERVADEARHLARQIAEAQ